jgi:hypothetical protein
MRRHFNGKLQRKGARRQNLRSRRDRALRAHVDSCSLSSGLPPGKWSRQNQALEMLEKTELNHFPLVPRLWLLAPLLPHLADPGRYLSGDI